MTENTITLAMIVKNEAGNLRNCLKSACGQVDEIVIVDTGSTDATPEIAREYTDRIYHFPWNEDFSAARNFAIEKARGEWILCLDADEELIPGTGSLKELVARDSGTEVYLLPLNNSTADTAGRYNRFHVLRLFKNNGRYRFQGKIHEQVTVPESGTVAVAEGPVINHRMLSPRERNRKRSRNLVLLKKAYSEDPQNHFLQYYLGIEWFMLGKADKALPFFRQAYRGLTDRNLLFKGPALRYLLICLKELGRLDEAICLCLEADRNYPEYTDIYYLGGILFEEKKEYLLAVKWFNRALKCGTPPPLYSHMNGAGSFLACYHLGYCYEMLGRPEAAMNYYEQALEVNPEYIYPLYNLFLAALKKYGPQGTLEYLEGKGYPGRPAMALAAAGLFFTSGYPDLALRCLKDCEAPREGAEEFCFYLGKYSIYSGNPRQGLDYLNRIPEESGLSPRLQIHRAVALLLLGRFPEARAAALELWKNHTTAPHAVVLLKLTRLVERGGPVNCPQRVRGMELGKAAREILDCCSRYLPGAEREPESTRFRRLFSGLEEIITNNSAGDCLSLIDYYRGKSCSIKNLLDSRFGSGGELP